MFDHSKPKINVKILPVSSVAVERGAY